MKILALCFLLAAPVAHCQTVVLPPLPDSVPSPMGAVRVVKVPHLRCALGNGSVAAFGCFSPVERVIAIRDSMVPQLTWKAFLHELGHMVLMEAGVRFDDGAQEERVVEAYATARLIEMLRERKSP